MNCKMVWLFPALLILPALACGGASAPLPEDASDAGITAVAPQTCAEIGQRPDGKQTFYEPNPTYTDPAPDTFWQTAAPEDVGLDGRRLNKGLEAMEKERSLFSVLVIKDGLLVAERYYNGSAADQSNNIHSASKSFLPMLVSIAIEQGYIRGLDQPIYQLLPARYELAGEKRQITVRHLLTMSSGVDWEENWTEFWIEEEPDWVGAILAREQAAPPGAEFNYSTGMTHVLSAVLTEATGMSTCEFARQNLFDPLGITIEHWGRDPQGVYSGGYNLYMTPRELAKMGLLQLQNGRWQGRQIFPQWMAQQAPLEVWSEDDGGYGMLWWRQKIEGYNAVVAWGYGGQFIYLIPELDLMLATTENTADDHWNAEIDPADFMRRYVLPALADAD
ncbi:MAG TPA: class C beta-lactamase-related serine hydrolase [Chloroflexi bacterium]|nr:class C beta-lactamase-related serine hydrolase [Chloroflexota bacterium]